LIGALHGGKRLFQLSLLLAVLLLVFSVVLGVLSLCPAATGNVETSTLINDSFTLTQNEYRRVGLGSFSSGENISVVADCTAGCPKNFSIVTPNATVYSTTSLYSFNYSFTATAGYYEALFLSNSSAPNAVHLQVSIQKMQPNLPYAAFNGPAKILFILSAAMFILFTLKSAVTQLSKVSEKKVSLPTLDSKGRRVLVVLVLLSTVFWLVLLALNTNQFGTFENWYTDHPRHSYEATLFLKDGFSVFSSPLGQLASNDNSLFKFVTWPETSHMYPIGSIMLFLPFGALLQSGANQLLIYKLEIGLFLLAANACVYLFLKYFWKQDLDLVPKFVGVLIMYWGLVYFAANGMFDSVAFIFSLFAVLMFVSGRYDVFFLLITLSISFKYQAGIFLLPLIIIAVIKIVGANKLLALLKNKFVLVGVSLAALSGFTAYLSLPYFLSTRPELSMNGINAFLTHPEIPWLTQSFFVLLTLFVTVALSLYMLKRNALISLSVIFLLIPVFMMPFFQNWYIPFVFVYALIPQPKKDLAITVGWLAFIIFMVAFGGISFSFLASKFF
jgi:hypothetical protein